MDHWFCAAGVRAILSEGGEVEYDEVIDHTINNIDIGGGNTLSVTLDHLPDPPAIGLEVKCSYITLL